MNKKRKYYVEVYEEYSDTSYILQSSWFDTIKEATHFAEMIGYLDADFGICINCADWYIDEDGYESYNDILPFKEIKI